MAVACGGLFPAAATAQSYQLVTSDDDLESGKRYLIVAENSGHYYAWYNFYGFPTDMAYAVEISPPSSAGTITDLEDAKPLQLVKSGDMWKIIDLETDKYVGLGSESSTANYLYESAYLNSLYLWNISHDVNGVLKVYQILGDNSKYLKLLFRNEKELKIFSIFDQSGGVDISLYKETGSPLILHNDKYNTTAISEAANANKTYDVILENRMLSKDGKWNTLCLPFDYSKTGGPLAGATIMELDTKGKYKYDNEKWEIDATNGTQKTGFNAADGTLCLFFKTAESIEAGKPYIIKWEGTSGVIDSPIFSNVTVSSATSDVTSSDGYVTFKGGYDVQKLTAGDTSILFLGGSNTLYYPSGSMDINAFRAYFQLNKGLTAGEPYSPESGTGNGGVRSFALSFGDNETSSIENVQCSMFNVQSEVWYTLDGRRLDGKPTARGIYVNSGRKVVVK